MDSNCTQPFFPKKDPCSPIPEYARLEKTDPATADACGIDTLDVIYYKLDPGVSFPAKQNWYGINADGLCGARGVFQESWTSYGLYQVHKVSDFVKAE
jgi:hypothetical protein